MSGHREVWQRLKRQAEQSPVLEADDEQLLLQAARAGDGWATQQLVHSHMRLVIKISVRYARAGLAPEDLVGEGVVGLIEALSRFDLSRGVRFGGYAAWWVRARVSHFALAQRRAVGIPSTRNARVVIRFLARAERSLTQRLARPPTQDELAHEIGVPADELAQVQAALHSHDLPLDLPLSEDVESPEQQVMEREHEQEQHALVQEALGRLSSRERALVHEHYLQEEGGRSLGALGREYGVSRQRLGQVLSNARQKLKAQLERVA
ncbi:MAG TPA: sigma-70 family RNA polymerase sigma factor [Polyangiales bacterium]